MGVGGDMWVIGWAMVPGGGIRSLFYSSGPVSVPNFRPNGGKNFSTKIR